MASDFVNFVKDFLAKEHKNFDYVVSKAKFTRMEYENPGPVPSGMIGKVQDFPKNLLMGECKDSEQELIHAMD